MVSGLPPFADLGPALEDFPVLLQEVRVPHAVEEYTGMLAVVKVCEVQDGCPFHGDFEVSFDVQHLCDALKDPCCEHALPQVGPAHDSQHGAAEPWSSEELVDEGLHGVKVPHLFDELCLAEKGQLCCHVRLDAGCALITQGIERMRRPCVARPELL